LFGAGGYGALVGDGEGQQPENLSAEANLGAEAKVGQLATLDHRVHGRPADAEQGCNLSDSEPFVTIPAKAGNPARRRDRAVAETPAPAV